MNEPKRGPGRPKKDQTEDVAEVAKTELADRKGRRFNPKFHDTDAQGKPVVKDGLLVLRKRDSRPADTTTLKLDASDYEKANPGMKLAWVNDIPGRINQFQANGYEPVQGGSGVVRRHVGRGESPEGMTAQLMMIPEEWHAEDKAKKQAQILDVDKTEAQAESYKPEVSGKDTVLA